MPFALRDGARVHWTLEGAPDCPPLLLLQPAGEDIAIWDAAAARLLDRFQILRTDRLGDGDRAQDPDAGAALARDGFAVMAAAGIASAAVAGFGRGGGIAVEMALLAPDRVQALALICTPAPDADEGAEALTARLERIACPTLIIGGRQDTTTPFERHGSVFANAIDGARSVLMDCGESPPAEAPDALAAQLIRFFLKPSPVADAEALLYQTGLRNRRRVLGSDYVDATLARRTPFNAEFQEMITRIAWHEIYSRPGLELRTRRLIVLAVTAATARWDEFRLHLRAAVTEGGVPRDDIKELLMQLAIYAGVPAANTGFAQAAEIFTELDAETD